MLMCMDIYMCMVFVCMYTNTYVETYLTCIIYSFTGMYKEYM